MSKTDNHSFEPTAPWVPGSAAQPKRWPALLTTTRAIWHLTCWPFFSKKLGRVGPSWPATPVMTAVLRLVATARG